MEFKLEHSARGQTDDALLDDLRRCANLLSQPTITASQYEAHGNFHPSTITRRFTSWPAALKRAGLAPSRSKIGISDQELFENIKHLWLLLGRQPRYSEVKKPDSMFSASTYENRFGSWTSSLNEFVKWINSENPTEQAEITPIVVDSNNSPETPSNTKRRALLHKFELERTDPNPGRSYAMAVTHTVVGRPSCVKRLSTATRTCNSTT